MSDYFGKDVPKLGFGLMRLPKLPGGDGKTIDVEQVKVMTDMFLDAGFTYFDTAYVYTNSEAAIKEALVDRHPRDSYTLATKLNAGMADPPTEKSAKQQFYTSLERTGAGYFDYYLLHSIQEKNVDKYDEYHLWDYVHDLKAKGLIKYLGFSFHDGPELLERVLTEHPEVDFVQLQLNYMDWENPNVTSRANYEVARRHGKSITVMEPVKGGTLADPPEEIKKMFEAYRPGMSPASWAIRFIASLDGIITVLSGMSNIAQMEDNLSYMKNFEPLDEEEQKIIQEAQRILGHSATVPCTACSYCTPGCPMQIDIPGIFKAMNKQIGNGQAAEAAAAYAAAAPEGHKASDCIGCKQCERVCPQHLEITKYLAQAAEMFEK